MASINVYMLDSQILSIYSQIYF